MPCSLRRYALTISELRAVKPGPDAAFPCPYPARRSSCVPPYESFDSPNPVQRKCRVKGLAPRDRVSSRNLCEVMVSKAQVKVTSFEKLIL